MSQVILETERLVLSTWGKNGADEMFALHSDPEVNHFVTSYNQDWSLTKAAERIAVWQTEFAELGLGKHRVTRKIDGAFVGRAGFSVPHEGQPELGYSLARAHWGQGYASEIAAALRDWFFATRTDPSFIGFAHRNNLASRRVLEKIGMTETHEAEVAGAPHRFYIKQRTTP